MPFLDWQLNKIILKDINNLKDQPWILILD